MLIRISGTAKPAMPPSRHNVAIGRVHDRTSGGTSGPTEITLVKADIAHITATSIFTFSDRYRAAHPARSPLDPRRAPCRIMNVTGETPMLQHTGESFAAAAEARGIDPDQALNPKAQDSRAIKHNGPNPHYGPKRKAS